MFAENGEDDSRKFSILKPVLEKEILIAIKELLKDIKNNIDLVASEINQEKVDMIMQITTERLQMIGISDQLRIDRRWINKKHRCFKKST